MTGKTHQRHRRILDQLDAMLELARDPPRLERQSSKVSEWSVGLQLEHTLYVHRSVARALDKITAGDGDGPQSPNPAGRIFLPLGWIPRGRGKAPAAVRPRGYDADRLAADLAEARESFSRIDLAALDRATGTLPHPVFGALDTRRWLRFLEVHNSHHWRIIREILQSSR